MNNYGDVHPAVQNMFIVFLAAIKKDSVCILLYISSLSPSQGQKMLVQKNNKEI